PTWPWPSRPTWSTPPLAAPNVCSAASTCSVAWRRLASSCADAWRSSPVCPTRSASIPCVRWRCSSIERGTNRVPTRSDGRAGPHPERQETRSVQAKGGHGRFHLRLLGLEVRLAAAGLDDEQMVVRGEDGHP